MARRKKGLSFYQKKKRVSPGLVREILEYIIGTVVVIFLAAVLCYFGGMRTSVIGNSMEPGLYNGQEILVNRFVYLLSSPKREDVVVFLPKGNENSHYYVKRIIGVPGDTLYIKDGKVYINGAALIEDEKYDKIADPGIAENEIVLGSDEFFVLGDNRNSSEDSRSGNVGAVTREMIVGKAWFYFDCPEVDNKGLIK